MLKADIVLATTPGLDVYQWKRSRDVKWYVHVFHAANDATVYRMFGLDYYDAVLLAGEFQGRQIRKLEELRNLPAKELVMTGLGYFDTLQERLDSAPALPPHETTVLLAPTWGPSGIFSKYGGSLIDSLLETGYHVIVRPHPQTFASETDLINGIMESYPESDQLEWNRDNDNFEVLRRSDILVSDFSGVIFDFALVFDKPVIYTEPEFDKAPYDACWLEEETWTSTTLPKIGQQLMVDNAANIKELIDECLTDPRFAQGREQAREECWCNRGGAASAVFDYLVGKHRELVDEEADDASDEAEAATDESEGAEGAE